MSKPTKKVDQAHLLNLAERAEQLSKEAERFRTGERVAGDRLGQRTTEFDKTVSDSVHSLRKLALR